MIFSLNFNFLDNGNPKRIYKIIFVIFIAVHILSQEAFCQNTGAYRTVGSGDFDQVSIWEVYDGDLWTTATAKPGMTNDVYIEFGHKVRLTQNESIKSLYLNAETNTGEKLDINDFELSLYGSLNAFSGAAPGIPTGAWNTIDWIGSSADSKLVFKGNSRIVVPSGAWSGFTTRSRYMVVFDADFGEEFTVQESFKANKFVIKSGTVIQEGTPGVECATFSFNNDPAVSGPYGDFVIENGATLESNCSEEIILRSASGLIPAALFDLEQGGSLVLNANDPEINAAEIDFSGTVSYASDAGVQNFVSSTMIGAEIPENYHHLSFVGNAQKNLPASLYLTGNMERIGGGSIVDNNTYLSIEGSADQLITGFNYTITSLDVDKSGGRAIFDDDLIVKEAFGMVQGDIDFDGNDLFINSSGSGSYTYTDGTWSNLNNLTYYDIPANLNTTNASFPFVDKYEGGTRLIQLLGNQTASNSDLKITYQQYNGVDHDADYSDNDGTPIMYQLNSYFTFSDLSTDNSDLVLRISAEDLIVDNEDDLRIVGDHQAAEGDHLAGEAANGQLWARREVTLSKLEANDFTIGSYRVATILPVKWLTLEAMANGTSNLVKWEVNGYRGMIAFRVYRAEKSVDNFKEIAKIPIENKEIGNLNFQIYDEMEFYFPDVYYQISIVDKYGKETFSRIFRAQRGNEKEYGLFISPNPYLSGLIKLVIPSNYHTQNFEFQVRNSHGAIVFKEKGDITQVRHKIVDKLKSLPIGIYFLSVLSREGILTTKWIKQ